MVSRRRVSRLLLIYMIFAIGFALAAAQDSSQQDPFQPYTSCHLSGGPDIVDVTPLDPGVTSRDVRVMLGYATIPITQGRRIMFAYPGEDFYANLKVEILPESSFAKSKASLLDNFDYLLASGDNVRTYKLKPTLNGFEIQGLDRTKREGGVLGFYLLFDCHANRDDNLLSESGAAPSFQNDGRIRRSSRPVSR